MPMIPSDFGAFRGRALFTFFSSTVEAAPIVRIRLAKVIVKSAVTHILARLAFRDRSARQYVGLDRCSKS